MDRFWARIALVCAAAIIPPASLAQAQTATPGLQATYDAAQTAFDNGDAATAASGFEKIVAPADGRAPSHVQAIIRARLAMTYIALSREDDALISAKIAARSLKPADGPDYVEVWFTIGDIARERLDMAQAIDAYRHVIDLPRADGDAATRIKAQTSFALAAMVVEPTAASAQIDALLADPKITTDLPKKTLAQIEDLKGRAQLNVGDLEGARKTLTQAVEDSGGSGGSYVDLIQAGIRQDMAIAAALLHRDEDLHEYLSAAGAGEALETTWMKDAHMKPPVCDGAQGVLPQDMAIVEFSIDDAGQVTGVEPVYATKAGPVGITFAKAVQDWRWSPDAVVKLNPFWRSHIRIQLRCVEQPPSFDVTEDFQQATRAWLSQNGASPDDLDLLKNLAVQASDPRLGRDDASGVAALLARAGTPGAHDLKTADWVRLDHILDRLSAPPAVRAYAILIRAQTRPDDDLAPYSHGVALRLGVARPAFDAIWPHTRAGAWLALEQALALDQIHVYAQARPILATILAEPESVLPANDNIRIVAALHASMADLRLGRTQAANADIAAAGVKPGQCSLLDVHPLAINQSVSSDTFPTLAARWGRQGLVTEDFDLSADGKTLNVRTVLAYPPFIFDDATEHAVSRFRYQIPTMDGQPIGCADQGVTFHFIPAL